MRTVCILSLYYRGLESCSSRSYWDESRNCFAGGGLDLHRCQFQFVRAIEVCPWYCSPRANVVGPPRSYLATVVLMVVDIAYLLSRDRFWKDNDDHKLVPRQFIPQRCDSSKPTISGVLNACSQFPSLQCSQFSSLLNAYKPALFIY